MTARTNDAWQAHVTRATATEVGRGLNGRGRLHQPIAALSLGELQCMAATAISRFVVLAAERIGEHPKDTWKLAALLLDQGTVLFAGGRPGPSATSASSALIAIPAVASARCAASTPARLSPQGTAA